MAGTGYNDNHSFAAQSSPESRSRQLSLNDSVLKVASSHNYTSPRRTFLILIVGVFMAEVISMIVISLLRPLPYAAATLLDAFIITALIIRLLYFFSLRPLLMHIESGEKKERELQNAVERLQELEFIVNQSPAIAFLWRNAAGRPVEFVSANIQEYGYSPTDFLDRKIDYASIIQPEDLDVVTNRVERFIQESRTEFGQEYRIVTRAGAIPGPIALAATPERAYNRNALPSTRTPFAPTKPRFQPLGKRRVRTHPRVSRQSVLATAKETLSPNGPAWGFQPGFKPVSHKFVVSYCTGQVGRYDKPSRLP